VRGKSGYVPFWPGGLDDVLSDPALSSDLNTERKGLRTIPPGFQRGLRFPGEEVEDADVLALDDIHELGRTNFESETVPLCSLYVFLSLICLHRT